MNKKSLALIALSSFAGAVLYRSLSRSRQADEYTGAINETLKYPEITNFKLFSDYLLEYYGIIAKNIFGNVVEYSSPRFSKAITSDELRQYSGDVHSYDTDDLETFFSSNRELWV